MSNYSQIDLLNESRFINKTGKRIQEVIFECICLREAMMDPLNESQIANEQESIDVLKQIDNLDFVVNDYESFCNELLYNKRASFLTYYTPEQLKEYNVKTYQVEGYPIGFALKPDPIDGLIDIIGVHNNSNIRNIGKALIRAAKKLGGNKLDHFDGYLSDFYQGLGFNEYERYKWDNRYAPKEWNADAYGYPDVIMRRT